MSFRVDSQLLPGCEYPRNVSPKIQRRGICAECSQPLQTISNHNHTTTWHFPGSYLETQRVRIWHKANEPYTLRASSGTSFALFISTLRAVTALLDIWRTHCYMIFQLLMLLENDDVLAQRGSHCLRNALKYLTCVSLSWSSSLAFYKTATYLVVLTAPVADLSCPAWAETHGGILACKHTYCC